MTQSRISNPSWPEKIAPRNDDSAADLSRLNAIRLIIVMIIATGYASTMSIGPGSEEWLCTFGYDPSLFGLQILFFLSGWLGLRSLEGGKSALDMLRSRAARNLPWVALYTLLVVAVLYPLLCDHDAPIVKGTGDLALYFVKTVTLVDPGNPMPGALDGALYMCLLQGTIWTLRIGAVAFIGLAALWALKLRHRSTYLGLAVIGTCIHIAVSHWTVRTGSELFEPFSAFLFFGHAFLVGLATYAYRHRLPGTARGWLWAFCALFALALIHWHFVPWTQAMQTLAMMSYCALTMAAIQSRIGWLQDWPNLILPTYLGIWPITQTILYFAPRLSIPELVAVSLASTLAVALIFRTSVDVLNLNLHRRVQTA